MRCALLESFVFSCRLLEQENSGAASGAQPEVRALDVVPHQQEAGPALPQPNAGPGNSSGNKRKRTVAAPGQAVERPWMPIPRYGNLDPAFYPVLRELPTKALPLDPPRGQYMYRITYNRELFLNVDLRGHFMLRHFYKNRRFPFYSVDDVHDMFERAHKVAQEWMASPPQPEPGHLPRPVRRAAAKSAPSAPPVAALPLVPAGGNQDGRQSSDDESSSLGCSSSSEADEQD